MNRFYPFSILMTLIPLTIWAGGPRQKNASGPLASTTVQARSEREECLLLNKDRYQAAVRWRARGMADFQEASGVLLDKETGFDETGYFWFNDPDNIDLVVRAFDGCGFNDHFWVFAAGLTDVEYELTVTDTQTSLTKTYSNDLGKISPPIQDTQAFATCPTPVQRNPEKQGGALKMGCDGESDALCLQDGRFRVEIDWEIPGQAGRGMVGVATPKSGGFWFLDRSDISVYLKIFDGRNVNGHFWLTYTSLTGAAYTMTVTDTETGLVREYRNPLESSTFGTDYFLTAPGDQSLVYPWVSDNNTFDSVVVANNNNCFPTDITLEAQRGDGATATTTRTIPALGFLEEAATDLFPELTGGSGYSVLLTSPNPGVQGRWVTNNRNTASSASPSQGVAIDLSGEMIKPLPANARVGQAIQFGYLPNQPGFFAGTVVVNVGDTATDVSLYIYNREGVLIDVNDELVGTLAPFQPFAAVSRNLLPTDVDSASMVAYSADQPLTGVVFIFNQNGEPAIGNASAINFAPPR